MIDTPRTIQPNQTLEFDVCIAGAGAAGITLALELDDAGLRVCLLEGGGFQAPGLGPNHPYAGENVGDPYNVLTTRLRYFGGTTNHWGGWCRPLDDIDFQARPFVPLSGWPISRRDLDVYYERAAKVCEIDPPIFDIRQLPGARKPDEEFYDHYDADFTTKSFRFSPPTRFGLRYRADIQNSNAVTCLLDSTVTEIETSAGEVTRFRVRSGTKEFLVKAGAYVVALGAIENARLLLNSDRLEQRGVGNESDFVGRCFADHVGTTLGLLLTSSQAPYLRYRQGDVDVMPHLSFRDEYLLEHQLVNLGIVFLGSYSAHPLGDGYMDDTRIYTGWEGTRDLKVFYALARAESTPNRESRVVLIQERDGNTMRRVRLDWRRNSIDLDTLEHVADFLAQKAGYLNFGRFRRTYWKDRTTTNTSQAHQLGTTRMSSDPELGVVDPNCKIHSISNLYVAGSSVFPTFGFANPTLTIVALTIRLADHLKRILK